MTSVLDYEWHVFQDYHRVCGKDAIVFYNQPCNEDINEVENRPSLRS